MSSINTVNPATEEVISSHDLMTTEAAFKRVGVCHDAFLDWRTKSHEQRQPYLRDIAAALRSNADELAKLMTTETGKLFRDGLVEVELCAQIFDLQLRMAPPS